MGANGSWITELPYTVTWGVRALLISDRRVTVAFWKLRAVYHKCAWLAGQWLAVDGGGCLLNITAAAWTAGFQLWRSGDITRTQNVSDYMLTLCLVYLFSVNVRAAQSLIANLYGCFSKRRPTCILRQQLRKFSCGCIRVFFRVVLCATKSFI